MKWIVAACLMAAAVAEPPRSRPARFREARLQRQELTTTDAPSTAEPYPAAGWSPAGAPFSLPKEQPDATYGPPAPYPAAGWQPAQSFQLPSKQAPPATSYGTPGDSYGAPTTDAANATESVTTTDKPQTERLDGGVEVQRSAGSYYVLLPSGVLQPVSLVPAPSAQYRARLQRRPRL